MIHKLLRAALAAVVMTLAACGGGSDTCQDILGGTACSGGGGGGGGTGSTPKAAELVLTLSAPSVTNDGSQTVVASVIAVDSNRNAVAGVPVTVSVNNGGVVTPSGLATDDTGVFNATIGIGSDRSERTIIVTATSASLTKTAELRVTATGGAVVVPSDLILSLSAPTIVNTGAELVVATVTALDAKRNVLPGTGVTITVDNGGTAAPSGPVTDAAGVLTANIGIGGSSTNRTIVVTAVAGGLTRTANLAVTDTVTNPGVQAADLSLTVSAVSLSNAGTSTVRATATAVDSNRNAVAGVPVTVRVDASAVATVSGPVTNASGVLTADIGIGADRSNRVVTVTATSGSLTRTASFRVVGAKLTAAYSPIVNTSSTGNQIEFSLVDINETPMPDQLVSLSSPQLGNVSGMTDARGKFVYTYGAPAAAGTLTLTASAAGYSLPENLQITVQASGTGSVPVAVGPLESASLTPSPSVVAVNADSSTDNQVQLKALFVRSGNTPVQNVRVRFDLADNANNSDGQVSWVGGDYAYTNANGVATATFRAGSRSSPTNGVTIRACYALNDWDFVANPCPNQVTNTITVANEALSVNIRTNELIKSGPAQLTYIKEFVVMVVDSAGLAKPDVLITPSVDLTGFHKGEYYWDVGAEVWKQFRSLDPYQHYTWNGTAWVAGSGQTSQPVCPNEDANRNGIREAGAVGGAVPALSARGEDMNWNGDIDPRKADVAIKMVGSSKTDANGLAIVQIEYGRSLASWVDYVITVTASGVAGTESRARYVGNAYGLGNLPVDAEALKNGDVSPAFVRSPYGPGEIIKVIEDDPRTWIPRGVCTDTK